MFVKVKEILDHQDFGLSERGIARLFLLGWAGRGGMLFLGHKQKLFSKEKAVL